MPGNASPMPQLGFVEFQLSKLAMEDLKLIFIWAHVKLIMRHGKIGTEAKAATRAQWGKHKQTFSISIFYSIGYNSTVRGTQKNPSPRAEPPLD
ncbi:hypothetical protein ACLKA6_001724 [Drosophila palustris]